MDRIAGPHVNTSGGVVVGGGRGGLDPVPLAAAATFVPAGLAIAVGAGLRWFTPGYTMDQRLGNAMSPLMPTEPEATVAGSVPLTAAGYVLLTVAALMLLRVTGSRGARVCAWLGAVPLAVTAAQLGVLTAWSAVTGQASPHPQLPVVGALVGMQVIGLAPFALALACWTRRTRPGVVAALALLVTPVVVEYVVLTPFSDAWDDPAGFGVLSGLAYVVVGLALLADRRRVRTDRPEVVPAAPQPTPVG